MEKRYFTRKVNKAEFPELISRITDSYADYPLYDVGFDKAKDRREAVYLLTYIRLYPFMDYTYTNDDLSACVCLLTPGANGVFGSYIKLLLEPSIVMRIARSLNFGLIRALISYNKMHNRVIAGKFDYKKDVFIKTLWMDKSLRSSILHLEALKEIVEHIGYYPRGYFFDTESKKHIRLYEMHGCEVVAIEEWRGVPHALMNLSAEKIEKIINHTQE